MPGIHTDSITRPVIMASTPPPGTADHRQPPVNPDDASDNAQGNEVPDEDIEPADTTAEDDDAENGGETPGKRG
ncbi:hypothetical protein [Achromobacter aegrifaciens]